MMNDSRLPIRFWEKINVNDDTGCWEWTAAITPKGYAYFHWKTRGLSSAHRVAYIELVGSIPTDMECDHLCRVRHCVNPSHIEIVTHTENVRRGANSTYVRGAFLCKNGLHQLADDNVYTSPAGQKTCKSCRRITSKRLHRHRMKTDPKYRETRREYKRKHHLIYRDRDNAANRLKHQEENPDSIPRGARPRKKCREPIFAEMNPH